MSQPGKEVSNCNSQELIVMSANHKVAILIGSSTGIGTDYCFLRASINNSKALESKFIMFKFKVKG